MKDPLYTKETPYEILEIPTDADGQTIKHAFRKIVSVRKSESQQAYRTLSHSVERTLTDVFLYNDSFLNQLQPCIQDKTQLLSRRMALAQAWSNIQKERFPHFASTHSLALLWYYWTLYCEEEQWARLNEVDFKVIKNLPSPPSLIDLWSNTISNWVFLTNSEDFWQEWSDSKRSTGLFLNKNDINTLKGNLVNHFINIFRDFKTKYREGKVEPTRVERFREYEFIFSTELETAKQLSDAGLRLSRGGKYFTISCGRMMLEQVGRLGDIQGRLDVLKTQYFNKPQYIELIDNILKSLSPYFNIAVLIENKKYDAAIRAIEVLSPVERKKVEVLQLLAKAYLEKIKQHFSLNQFEEALTCWKRAVNTGKLSEEIKKDVISNCKAKAASLQRKDPDTSIKILEKALKFVKDKELMLTLAEILNQRGFQMIYQAQRKLESSKKSKKDVTCAIKAVEEGIPYLERAVEIGSEQAVERLKDAKKFLKWIKSPFFGLSPEVAELVQKANEAAEGNGNFDEGIKILNRAQKKAKEREKPAVKKMLAQFLNAHAVKKIEKAMTKINPIMEQHQKKTSKKVADFLSGKSAFSFFDVFTILLIGAGVGYVIFGKAPKDFFGRLVLSFFLFWVILKGIAKIIEWFQKNISIPLYIPGDNRPSCKLCNTKAAYTFDLTPYIERIPWENHISDYENISDEHKRMLIETMAKFESEYKEVPFCSKHADKLRSIIKSVPKLDSPTISLVKSAEKDLKQALKLDPNIKQVQQNLEHVDNILSRFDLK